MQWYYSKNGAQLGPIGSAEMQSKLVSGDISPADLVWREGMADWLPAGQVAELQAMIAPPAERPAFEPPVAPAVPYAAAQAPVHVVVTDGGSSQGLAIASMVCGILSLITWCLWCISGPLALVAVVLGHIALGRVKADPARFTGKGMAKAGVITGYLGLLAAIAMIVLGVYMQSLTPEQIERMDFLPPEVRESFNKQLELQQRLKESQQ
jgi:hypothetical protein